MVNKHGPGWTAGFERASSSSVSPYAERNPIDRRASRPRSPSAIRKSFASSIGGLQGTVRGILTDQIQHLDPKVQVRPTDHQVTDEASEKR